MWQYTCLVPQTKTKTIIMGGDRDILTQNNIWDRNNRWGHTYYVGTGILVGTDILVGDIHNRWGQTNTMWGLSSVLEYASTGWGVGWVGGWSPLHNIATS